MLFTYVIHKLFLGYQVQVDLIRRLHVPRLNLVRLQFP